MYVPSQFEVADVARMHGLIRAYPLATLVTLSTDELNANHIPLALVEVPEAYGILQGHIARANPLLDNLTRGTEALAIFHGPNAYITPTWYATKKQNGCVVPTWNYVVVHAYGKLTAVDSPEWLRQQLGQLTNANEAQFTHPWAVDDAPLAFTEKLMHSIIGVEMKITKLIGKWKVSQNQVLQNQEGVIAGLRENPASETSKMAEFVKNAPKK